MDFLPDVQSSTNISRYVSPRMTGDRWSPRLTRRLCIGSETSSVNPRSTPVSPLSRPPPMPVCALSRSRARSSVRSVSRSPGHSRRVRLSACSATTRSSPLRARPPSRSGRAHQSFLNRTSSLRLNLHRSDRRHLSGWLGPVQTQASCPHRRCRGTCLSKARPAMRRMRRTGSASASRRTRRRSARCRTAS